MLPPEKLPRRLWLLAFITLTLSAVLACAALILASLRRHAPERAAKGLVFFPWNPLLILETGLGVHNDAVMLVLVLREMNFLSAALRAAAVLIA